MNRLIRLAAGAVVATAGLLAAGPVKAQIMCNDTSLMNPIIVTGSTAFEAALKAVAVKIAVETPIASTIIYAQASSAQGSCNGVSTIVSDTDLGGTQGRYYTLTGTTITNNSCTFATGQKAHVGLSDVYYESCGNVTKPRPAEIMDVAGPAQAMLFIVPKTNTATQYLTYKEAQLIYGCGVSSTRTIAGFSDNMGIFCRNANSGTQITIAKNIGLPETVLTAPICIDGGGTSGVGMMVMNYPTATQTIGFVSADYYDSGTNRSNFNALAFEALGQTKAYYADSSPDIADRKNVRDGHYGIWGYEHFIVKTTNGTLSSQATDFIGYYNGTKAAAFDYVALEGAAGVIPLCAMKVQRSADGGLMSPYTPAESCNCAFEAAIGKTATPAGCTTCSASTPCATGTCRHGFCE